MRRQDVNASLTFHISKSHVPDACAPWERRSRASFDVPMRVNTNKSDLERRESHSRHSSFSGTGFRKNHSFDCRGDSYADTRMRSAENGVIVV